MQEKKAIFGVLLKYNYVFDNEGKGIWAQFLRKFNMQQFNGIEEENDKESREYVNKCAKESFDINEPSRKLKIKMLELFERDRNLVGKLLSSSAKLFYHPEALIFMLYDHKSKGKSVTCQFCGVEIVPDNLSFHRIDHSLPHVPENVNITCESCKSQRPDSIAVAKSGGVRRFITPPTLKSLYEESISDSFKTQLFERELKRIEVFVEAELHTLYHARDAGIYASVADWREEALDIFEEEINMAYFLENHKQVAHMIAQKVSIKIK